MALSENKLRLMAEAESLGISFNSQDRIPSEDRLQEMIADKTREIANAEALKLNATEVGAEDLSDLNLDGAFDEVMGETRGVLVRVTTWTEWMPTQSSVHDQRISVEDGLTGFEAGENEKVVKVEGIRTPLIKEVDIEGPDGEKAKRHYALYAFNAILAQNVKTTLLSELIADQDPGDAGRLVGGPGSGSGLVITDDMPKAAGGPNRAARRRSNGKR